MGVKEKHKAHLRKLGVKDKDFALFNGKDVCYEYDEKKGARIYDPYYKTSYNGYIEIDGWSAWSREKETFMDAILEGTAQEVEKMRIDPEARQTAVNKDMKKKFGKKVNGKGE